MPSSPNLVCPLCDKRWAWCLGCFRHVCKTASCSFRCHHHGAATLPDAR